MNPMVQEQLIINKKQTEKRELKGFYNVDNTS